MMKLFATSYDNFKAPKIAGIYTITNTVNNKVYIGETVNLGNRFSDHIDKLIKNQHCNKSLQADFNSYNIQKFNFKVIYILDSSKLSKDDIANYLLYLEAAYYRKYEQIYDFYNMVVPYEAIDQHEVWKPEYSIDIDKIKVLLDTDPFNIGYDKIEWTPPLHTLDLILSMHKDYDADKFELAISTYKDFDYFTIKRQFFKTYKYKDCQQNGRRSLLCILKEVGTINITNRCKYFPRAYLSEGVSEKYIYQDNIYFSDKAKTKRYINCQKPIILSYQAQLDIINYLKNIDNNILKKIDIDYKQFQINYFMSHASNIDKDIYLNKDHELPYTVETIFN